MRPFPAHLSRKGSLILILSLVVGLLIMPLMLGRRPVGVETPPTSSERAREAYGRVPLSFEANRGQAEDSVNFLARGAGYTIFLKPSEAVFVMARPQASAAVLRMRLSGADEGAVAEGADELEGKANYLVGDDPSRWRTGLPTYGRVRYARVYPGIDLVYYGNQRQLEYDFRVAPGADARAVSLEFEGADKVELDAGGDLLLTLGESVIRQPRPVVYQDVAGGRRAVKGGYALGDDGRVGFALGAYDASLPLVIDPVIIYSTYLGGTGGEQALAVAVDPAGNSYMAGFTNSTNFPTANAIQAANGGFQDAFVAKLNAAGTGLVYSTYLGGSSNEQARGLTVDSAGNAYVTGFTSSTNFPTANAFDATRGSNADDAFVTKLNPTGSALIYSTYLGGDDSAEFGQAIAVDSGGNAYVTGSTFSTDFPTLNPIQAAKGGGSTDAFLTKINSTGSALVYSTYLGGAGNDTGFGITADSAGNAYLTGETESTNFPTLSPIQAANGGMRDAFVVKVNATPALVYSTYLGGSELEVGQSIAVDSTGAAYVAGQTFSTNFPTANAFQNANGGVTSLQDAFLTKINPSGGGFVYSTYFGGTGGEIAFGVAVDSSGNAYLGGATSSGNSLPTANALQCTTGGAQDAFVAKFNPAGAALIYSTYYGGNSSDNGRGVAIDSSGNAYVAGFARSTNFPVVNPIQSSFGGDAAFGDAFIFKLADTSTGPLSQLQFTQTAPTVQEDMTSIALTVQRTGDTTQPVTVDYATADGTASERSDYTTAVGTLRFAANETTKTIEILINEDSKTEGTENFTVSLSNPTGGATLSCLTATATIQITDDAGEPSTNVIDDTTIFVGQHYHDFLNRQADAPGLGFWTGQITSCGADTACIAAKRTSVSQAFFISIEFQQTGFYVFRFYKGTFTDSPARPRGLPRYREFLRDTQEIGRGVIVGQGNWEQQLAANKQEFARRWVQSAEFVSQFPAGMTAEAFVDKLFQNSEVTPTPSERAAAIAAFGTGDTEGRANAVRSVAESGSVYNRQFNPAFVLIQYIGYLRRNPNDAPDADFSGYDFWLNKLNQFTQPGEDVRDPITAQRRVQRAEMVRAFLISSEYRGRFGQP